MAQKVEVRYLVPMEGPDVSIVGGDERKVDAAEAKRLFEAGFAEPVAKTPRARSRKATAPDAETR